MIFEETRQIEFNLDGSIKQVRKECNVYPRARILKFNAQPEEPDPPSPKATLLSNCKLMYLLFSIILIFAMIIINESRKPVRKQNNADQLSQQIMKRVENQSSEVSLMDLQEKYKYLGDEVWSGFLKKVENNRDCDFNREKSTVRCQNSSRRDL